MANSSPASVRTKRVRCWPTWRWRAPGRTAGRSARGSAEDASFAGADGAAREGLTPTAPDVNASTKQTTMLAQPIGPRMGRRFERGLEGETRNFSINRVHYVHLEPAITIANKCNETATRGAFSRGICELEVFLRMARLEITLLGTFQVKLDGELLTGFRSDKSRALLAYLAVESTRPHRRDWLASLLWGNSDDRASAPQPDHCAGQPAAVAGPPGQSGEAGRQPQRGLAANQPGRDGRRRHRPGGAAGLHRRPCPSLADLLRRLQRAAGPGRRPVRGIVPAGHGLRRLPGFRRVAARPAGAPAPARPGSPGCAHYPPSGGRTLRPGGELCPAPAQPAALVRVGAPPVDAGPGRSRPAQRRVGPV